MVAAGRRSPLKPDVVAEGYRAYERHKQRAGLVDFDDLLALCARALEEDDRFATAQRWRYRHLYVDELQDVNPLQFRLLEAWRGAGYDVPRWAIRSRPSTAGTAPTRASSSTSTGTGRRPR